MCGKRLREGNKKCESGNLKGIDHLGGTGTEGKVLFGILQYSSVQ